MRFFVEKPGASPFAVSPLPRFGDYLDGFHNKITMLAYARSPDDSKRSNSEAGGELRQRNGRINPRFPFMSNGSQAVSSVAAESSFRAFRRKLT